MKKFISGFVTGAMLLAAVASPVLKSDVYAAGYKVTGYVKPNVTSTNSEIKKNFKVEIVEVGKSVLTDANGYFEISDVEERTSGYTLKISKTSYLTRQIKNVAVKGTVIVGSSSSPVEIWAGDIAEDNAINFTDIVRIAGSFNTSKGSANYKAEYDINMNGAISMDDIMLVASNFNKTVNNYSTITPTTIPSSITSPTATPTKSPTPTPTTSVNPSDAWELNKGTITLGSSISYTGTGISVSGSTVKITAGGDHTVTGTLSNGMILVDTTERVKLRLSNASITNSTGPAIYAKNADKLFITLDKGTTNTLADGQSYSDQTLKAALFSNDDLEIKGSGTLNITGNFKHAICSDDDINIENGIINVKSAKKDGIHANGSIDITGGTLDITATVDAIQNEDQEGITIDDGKLTLSAGDQAIRSKTGKKVAGGITINGGTINITKSREGISAELITINGGTTSIIASDDCTNATMGSRTDRDDGSLLLISGGSVYASSANGDALDSNGSITIAGGTVVVSGPQGMPNVPIDSNGTFTVTGGTVLATGPSMMMAQYPTGASAQYSLAVGLSSTQAANSAVCIKDSTGKVLLITKPVRNYVNIVFSSPELKNGSTYTVSYGGTVSGGTNVNGVITGGTYSGGSSTNVTINKSPTTTVNWSGGWGGGWGGF